jgi:hypothetical protein
MGENLNGLSVAQHDETAVGLAVADLLDATRVVGRLAISKRECWVVLEDGGRSHIDGSSNPGY